MKKPHSPFPFAKNKGNHSEKKVSHRTTECRPTTFSCPTAPILGAAIVSSTVPFPTLPDSTSPSFAIPPNDAPRSLQVGIAHGTVSPAREMRLVIGIEVLAPGVFNISGTFVLLTNQSRMVHGYLIFTPFDVTNAPGIIFVTLTDAFLLTLGGHCFFQSVYSSCLRRPSFLSSALASTSSLSPLR